ncbi:hypothetical protein EAX61_05860 [Dokdonia sinensis]|uniref:DUF4738 domain-containing protein n=1 Tax=Dokdonia sinensis TaxID=2479847 RepID=A0A3M0G7R3_9FLAO|nr:hypothetical protein [Dokdonia sinensis]RMB61005.1 hypothetical protein EAX61_05860 [Dokdonia sinensis]
MIKKYLLFLICVVLFVACTETDPYAITDNSIGPLTKTTQLRDLEKVFENDSVINTERRSKYKGVGSPINIFEKNTGKKLLSIMPSNSADTSYIENIQIFDERYKTAKGISLKSTFKDITKNYTIKRIDNLIGAAVIFVNESDAYFTIDKKLLPPDLMFDSDKKIEVNQIPDDTPIKYFMVGW